MNFWLKEWRCCVMNLARKYNNKTKLIFIARASKILQFFESVACCSAFLFSRFDMNLWRHDSISLYPSQLCICAYVCRYFTRLYLLFSINSKPLCSISCRLWRRMSLGRGEEREGNVCFFSREKEIKKRVGWGIRVYVCTA